MVFDDIIVGSGSSGAVLAARLSEDSDRKVLLIEAGPDYPSVASTPGTLLDGRHLPSNHDWGLTAEMVSGRTVDYARGKVIGGSSSVNACLALRGMPADYDEWRALGNTDWDWARVLPVFRDIEADELGAGDYHGGDGPIPIRRYGSIEHGPAQAAFVAACEALDFSTSPDNNHPDATGVGSGPWNHRLAGNQTIRGSTAIAYLLPARDRESLTILADCLVDRVLFERNQAVGVEVKNATGRERLLGRRITLCGGAFGSPSILLRSGVGPADDLVALDVEPRISLDGVGRNLTDHAFSSVSWETPPGVIDEDSPLIQVLLRYTARGSSQDNDMQVIPFQYLPQPAFQLGTMLMKPHSRGTLQLRSKDPEVQPNLRFNLASEREDIRRLVEGLKLLSKLVQTPDLIAIGSDRVSIWDGSTLPATKFAKLVDQDAWAQEYVLRSVRHYVHAVGTARMGPANDPGAVVDQHGRVHGAVGLRVADASIMPTIPRANTSLTCIMIGERIATWMREQDD